MAEDQVITIKARGYPSGTPGRAIVASGNHHFVSDEPAFAGGPGEEVGAGEFFLFGLTACAVGMLENVAKGMDVPLQWTEVSAEETFDMAAPPVRQDVTVLHKVRVDFSDPAVQQANAEPAKFVAGFQGIDWKIWVYDPTTGEAGGLYLFQDEASLESYLEGPTVAQVKEQLSDVSIKRFDIADGLTKMTRGPVG